MPYSAVLFVLFCALCVFLVCLCFRSNPSRPCLSSAVLSVCLVLVFVCLHGLSLLSFQPISSIFHSYAILSVCLVLVFVCLHGLSLFSFQPISSIFHSYAILSVLCLSLCVFMVCLCFRSATHLAHLVVRFSASVCWSLCVILVCLFTRLRSKVLSPISCGSVCQ